MSQYKLTAEDVTIGIALITVHTLVSIFSIPVIAVRNIFSYSKNTYDK